MYGIFLDGESKTGKTTVGSAIEADLAKDYQVYKAVAGSFYRRLTVLAVEAHGEYTHGDLSWLEDAMKGAIASREAYSEDRNWDAINSKEIDELVSVAGQLPIVQAAGKEWWPVMADRALAQDADVLVVDGRNPRAMLADWRAGHDMPIALDLCVYCDVEVAALRYVRSQGVLEPSDAQLTDAKDSIVKRRALDRNRSVAAYEEPPNQIDFDSGVSDAGEVVHQAFQTNIAEPPQVIRFDTTHSPLEVTQVTAGALARAALQYLNQKNKS
jgi:cytidylate kinase